MTATEQARRKQAEDDAICAALVQLLQRIRYQRDERP